MPFRHEGKSRTFNANLLVAFTLSGVAGAVNVIGFLELGTFTSHVSGAGTRLGQTLAESQWKTAAQVGGMLAFFCFGAMMATLFIERARYFQKARYHAAMILEALTLTAFTLATEFPEQRPAWTAVPLVWTLCFAMGLQNALVTKISGAVVRTTHLTGVVTDLGIETVRLLFWFRARTRGASVAQRMREAARVRADPELYRARLHLTILLAFISGGAVGTALYRYIGPPAMLGPVIVVVALVIYDLVALGAEEVEGDYHPTGIADPAVTGAAAPLPANEPGRPANVQADR